MSKTQSSELSATSARLARPGAPSGGEDTCQGLPAPGHAEPRTGFSRDGLNPFKSERDPSYAMGNWEAAVELIRQANSILLICHVSPDGDAIGSLLGLGLGLGGLGKQPILACQDNPPAKFDFLPAFDSIVNSIDSYAFDLVVGLDSSDAQRLGEIYDTRQLTGIPLINIDHHATNLYFGDVNLVDPQAASTAEIVLFLLDQLGVPLGTDARQSKRSLEIATCLLTGIVTDTLSFRTSNVTPQVLKAATRLMEAGASLPQVTHFVFHQRPLAELDLLARGLNRIQAEDGLAWSEITLSDRRNCREPVEGDADLVGMLVRTQEVQMAAVFTEKENNLIEISFRADPGFDVAQLALRLGGGGHPAASGCTIQGPLDAATSQVVPLMRTALNEQRKTEGS